MVTKKIEKADKLEIVAKNLTYEGKRKGRNQISIKKRNKKERNRNLRKQNQKICFEKLSLIS